VNTESTELQKIICEMKNIASERLKVSLLCFAMSGFTGDKLLQL